MSPALPLQRVRAERVENVTDWALGQFQKHYERRIEDRERAEIRLYNPEYETDIFHYVYAVLHHPAYRAKYEINLKREFPRIPFYEDFWQVGGVGEEVDGVAFGV